MLRTLIVCALILSIGLAFSAGRAWPADSNVINVRATVLSSSNCRFSPPKLANIDFGIVDPLNPVNLTVSASLIVRCSGSSPLATFFISDDDGLYETGANANRMRHAIDATQFMPYSLSLTPDTATIPRNTDQTITITATLNGASYQNAIAGVYADTVTVNIVP
ncbi:MAG: spore coat protein U domain-containing protein [Nitrospirota bacterium]